MQARLVHCTLLCAWTTTKTCLAMFAWRMTVLKGKKLDFAWPYSRWEIPQTTFVHFAWSPIRPHHLKIRLWFCLWHVFTHFWPSSSLAVLVLHEIVFIPMMRCILAACGGISRKDLKHEKRQSVLATESLLLSDAFRVGRMWQRSTI